MIPLSYFLVAWVILLAIFGVMLMLTLVQMLRHGLSTFGTYASTFIFLVSTVGVLIGVTIYLGGVDWKTEVNVIPEIQSPLFPDDAV